MEEETRYCTGCGTALEPDGAFCSRCGRRAFLPPETSVSPSPAASVPVPRGVSGRSAVPASSVQTSRYGDRVGWLLVILGGLAVAGIVVAIVMVRLALASGEFPSRLSQQNASLLSAPRASAPVKPAPPIARPSVVPIPRPTPSPHALGAVLVYTVENGHYKPLTVEQERQAIWDAAERDAQKQLGDVTRKTDEVVKAAEMAAADKADDQKKSEKALETAAIK